MNEDPASARHETVHNGRENEFDFISGRHQPLILAARICLLAAVVGAGYLALVALQGGSVAGCGPQSGCDRVLSSRWAYWLGLPVSLPALAVYVVLLGATFSINRSRSMVVRRAALKAMVALSLLVLAAALWFVAIQRFVVHGWCGFCLATHACAATAACLLLVALWKSHPETAGSLGRSGRTVGPCAFAATLALTVLVAGQLAVEKRLHGVTATPRLTGADPKLLNIHQGRFKLDPKALPVLGSSDAPNIIVSVFDYTCSHCRTLHALLRAAEEKHSGRLAVITLAMPLDAACNPLISVTASGNKDACQYARLSLAVWHANPGAFRAFDDWLLESSMPPPIELAYAKATAAVGKELLDRAMSGAWVTRQLQTNIEIYEANSHVVRDGRLPQLVFGGGIAHGAINNLEQLLGLIGRHMPLNQPDSADVRPQVR